MRAVNLVTVLAMAMPPTMGPKPQQQLQNFMRHRQEAQWLKSQRENASPAPKDMLEQAAEHYQHRRYAEASALYRQLATVPLVADQALCSLGIIALAQGDKVSAAQQFQQSLTINPSYANALYYLGEMAEKSGDTAAAVEYQRRTLAASPAHAGAVAAMARMDSTTGSPGGPAVSAQFSAPAQATSGLGVYEYLKADTSLL